MLWQLGRVSLLLSQVANSVYDNFFRLVIGLFNFADVLIYLSFNVWKRVYWIRTAPSAFDGIKAV